MLVRWNKILFFWILFLFYFILTCFGVVCTAFYNFIFFYHSGKLRWFKNIISQWLWNELIYKNGNMSTKWHFFLSSLIIKLDNLCLYYIKLILKDSVPEAEFVDYVFFIFYNSKGKCKTSHKIKLLLLYILILKAYKYEPDLCRDL